MLRILQQNNVNLHGFFSDVTSMDQHFREFFFIILDFSRNIRVMSHTDFVQGTNAYNEGSKLLKNSTSS